MTTTTLAADLVDILEDGPDRDVDTLLAYELDRMVCRHRGRDMNDMSRPRVVRATSSRVSDHGSCIVNLRLESVDACGLWDTVGVLRTLLNVPLHVREDTDGATYTATVTLVADRSA